MKGRGSRARGAAVAVLVMGILATGILAGCGGDSHDTLPGRSRPILDHDWPSPGEVAPGPAAFTPPDPSEALYETSSGARAYIVAGTPADPLVRLTAALPVGRLHERAGEAGASALLIQLLTTRGPVGASDPLTLRLAELGASLGRVEALDAAHLSLSVLPEDWQEALELLVELVRNPDLDVTTIRDYRTGPGYDMPMAGIGGNGFRPKVELERRIHGHPLAPPDPGTMVSREAVRALASRSLAADRVIFGVGGPVSRAEVEEALEAATRGWARSGEPLPDPWVIEPTSTATGTAGSATRFHAVDVPSLEGWIAIGRAVDAVPESDRAALSVLRFILAERLNIAAREMRGLANRDDFEVPVTASGTGLLLVRTGGRPEAVAPLVRYSLDEVERMHDPDAPVTEAEVARARGWLVNAVWRRSLELATSASGTFALERVRRGSTDHLMGWPAMVQAVTPDDVKAIAREYLDPATFVTVVAGPLERIRAARHPRWPVGLDEMEAELGRP
ncbi:MAG: insulinase family protein [Gammaproteobacteria bacterium]|nr:insulinase family protein [Gammaproteobacteria bacterium]